MKRKIMLIVLRWLCKQLRFEPGLGFLIAYKHLDRALMFLMIEEKRKERANVQNSVYP